MRSKDELLRDLKLAAGDAYRSDDSEPEKLFTEAARMIEAYTWGLDYLSERVGAAIRTAAAAGIAEKLHG